MNITHALSGAISQADFHPVEAPRFDDSTDPQTITLAERGTVRRTNVTRFDIDPRIGDPSGDLEARLFSPGRYPTPALHCSRVPAGSIGWKCGVHTEDGTLLIESRALLARLVSTDDAAFEATLRAAPKHMPVREVDEDVVVFAALPSTKLGNYYHWLTEGLSRAAVAVRAGVPDHVRFLMPGPISEDHVDMVALLGIEPDRLVLWDGEPTQYRTVYIPSVVSTHADGVSTASALMLNELGPPPPKRPAKARKRRFYISRLRASRRPVSTEKEIMRRAKRLGFESLETEGLKMEEKISLMREADMIAGLYGAGLTNALWMPSDAMVCEITLAQLRNKHELAFWNLASARGQQYALHIADSTPEPAYAERLLAAAIGMRDGERPVPRRRRKPSAAERKQMAAEQEASR